MPSPLPPRIWVVGPTGAGKSTVAAQLARHLGVGPIHLDELHWRPGWREVDDATMGRDLARALARPTWVVDGNYRVHRRHHADEVDLTVWLDLPLPVTLPRLLRRVVRRSLRKEPCCHGNRETLRRAFLTRDSILLWALTSTAPLRRRLAAELASRPHVRLGSPGAVRRWLAAAGVRPAVGTPPRRRPLPSGS